MFICFPPRLLGMVIIYKLVIFCYLQGQASCEFTKILCCLFKTFPLQILNIASHSTKSILMRHVTFTLQQPEYLLYYFRVRKILIPIGVMFTSVYPQTLFLSIVSESKEPIFMEDVIHILEKSFNVSMYTQNRVNCHQETSFPKNFLCLNMAKINCLVSDSKSFNQHHITMLS